VVILHDEGHVETTCQRYYNIDPPQTPCLLNVRIDEAHKHGEADQLHESVAPSRHTDKHDHVYNRSKTHREGAYKKTLCWMPNHCEPYLRIYRISHDGDEGEKNE
jgi:hypothetical protein